ncbi:MAG: EVE domain-containing protein [Nitrososphaerales archaeon]
MVNHYIFVAKDHICGGAVIDAFTIFEDRVKKRLWGLTRYVAHKRKLSKGDKVIFYVSSKKKNRPALFTGCGVIDSNPYLVSDVERRLCLALLDKYSYIVDLADIEVWPKPLPFKSIHGNLTFIKNSQKPFVYLQGGIVKIGEEDYLKVCNTAKLFMSSNDTLNAHGRADELGI